MYQGDEEIDSDTVVKADKIITEHLVYYSFQGGTLSMKKQRETFDEMDEIKAPVVKNVTLFIFVHLLAFIYVFIWQFVLTI